MGHASSRKSKELKTSEEIIREMEQPKKNTKR